MSYLLTEIALEMLGYKFYDYDGISGETNFQNSIFRNPHNSGEKTLEEFLNEDDDTSSTNLESAVIPQIEKEKEKIRGVLVKKTNAFRDNELYKLEYANRTERELMEKHLSEQRNALQTELDSTTELRLKLEQHLSSDGPASAYEIYLRAFNDYAKTTSSKRDA